MAIPYEERNISLNPEAKAHFREKGYDILPVLEIGNTTITDYTGEPQLIEALHSEGYL
jgi:hypothetical protein